MVRSDATNAKVWQREKLNTTEVDATVVTEAITASDRLDTAGLVTHRRKALGALQVVRSSGGSLGEAGALTHALMNKQLASVTGGLVSFTTSAAPPIADAEVSESRAIAVVAQWQQRLDEPNLDKRLVIMWVVTLDNGRDCVWSKRMLEKYYLRSGRAKTAFRVNMFDV